jgi:hypothetical protein
MYRLCTLLLAAFVLAASGALAQQRISTYPYSQDFSFVFAGMTAFPSGNANGGEFTLDAVTPGWTTNIANQGLNDNGGGAVRIQPLTGAGGGAAGFVFYGDLTGFCADSLSIDWAKVQNAPTGNRVAELRIATNSGNGAVFTDLPLANVVGGAWPSFDNSGTAQSGTLRVKLPSSLSRSSDSRIRIYAILTGGTGNDPRVVVDNLNVSANGAPSAGTIDSIGSVGTISHILYVNPGIESDSILVLRSTVGTPTFVPVDNANYTVGTLVNATDQVVYYGPANVRRIPFSGLQQGTTYYYAVYGKRNCNGRYSSSAVTASSATLASCAGAPANVSGLTMVSRGQDSVRFDFGAGSRTDSILVVRRLRVAPSFTPTLGTRYAPGQGVNATDTIAYFGPVTFPVTINNLQSDSSYVFAVYGVQSCNLAYSPTAQMITIRTYCTGTVANVADVTARYTTATTAALDITATSGATNYVVFSAGPDISVPSPADGSAYTVGSVIGDDTVKYIGSSRQVVLSGLAPSTTYRFWAYGYRECNLSYSVFGDSVTMTTQAPCIGTTPGVVDSIKISRNVRDTLQLRWGRSVNASEYVVVARIDSTPTTAPVNGTFYAKNDSLGRGFVLGRSTDTTITFVGLPANTAYFIRIYPVRNCDLSYGSAPLILPVATRGTATSQRFAVRAGSTDTIRFAGTVIQFVNPVTADGSLLITRNSGALSTAGLPLFRANRPPITVLSADRWWSFRVTGLGNYLYHAFFDITGVPGIQDTNDLAMVYRRLPNLPWEDFIRSGYQVDSTGHYIIAANRSVFESEFAIGANGSLNTLPVKLISFDGFSHNGRNTLRWRTASEVENVGFRLYRAAGDGANDDYTLVADYLTDASLRGAGTSNVQHSYGFVDASTGLKAGGRYTYKLEEVALDGSSDEVGRIALAMTPDASAGAALFSIAPNPVSGSYATISYTIVEDAPVSITLVNSLGQTVRTLVSEPTAVAGTYTLPVDLHGLAAGAYFCQVRNGGTVATHPITIVR